MLVLAMSRARSLNIFFRSICCSKKLFSTKLMQSSSKIRWFFVNKKMLILSLQHQMPLNYHHILLHLKMYFFFLLFSILSFITRSLIVHFKVHICVLGRIFRHRSWVFYFLALQKIFLLLLGSMHILHCNASTDQNWWWC